MSLTPSMKSHDEFATNFRSDSTCSSLEPLLEFESIKAKGPALDEGEFGNPYCRFTILYAFLIFLFATIPLWLGILIPNSIAAINACIYLAIALMWISIAVNAWNNFHNITYLPQPSLNALSVIRNRKFTHIVVIPCYLDPIEILFDCLGSLLIQDDPSSLMVVVAFEATTPDLLLKEQTVHQAFHNRFGHFLITIHRVNSQKEIAGGCSNKNYALHEAFNYLRSQRDMNIHKDPQHSTTITTCDTDSLFHPNYFYTLERVYNARNPEFNVSPKNIVWQAPLFYNWDLDKRPFFNRITCLMRSMMMLGGLISFNLNPMSIFSYPLELGLQVGFINPRYGVDDIIAKVRWMCATNEAVPVELLPVACISGPTIGKTFLDEYDEWARQIRRWIVGSSESFHYFLIHWRGKPFFAGISWFLMFFSYYALLLCCAGIFAFLAGVRWPWVVYPVIDAHTASFSLSRCGYLFLGIQYVVFAVAFVLDYRAKRLMTVKENISVFRNIGHWLLAPPTLLWYSVIAFASIIAFTWKGKKMARHDMAGKEGLENSRKQHNDFDAPSVDIRRVRSTSTAVDEERSRIGSTASKAPWCKLPERFYFGQYSAPIPPVIHNKNEV
jgi:cellulose synthase/poly-beta-1,6-N-acetylglucosamine synthase-like glycosyltransferase